MFVFFRKWDWVVIALAIVALIIFASYVRPAKVVVDGVAKPVAEEVGIVNKTCPGGWANTSSHDEHLQRQSCQKGKWLAVLDGEGKFVYGIELDTPGAQFQYDKSKVPDWPADR